MHRRMDPSFFLTGAAQGDVEGTYDALIEGLFYLAADLLGVVHGGAPRREVLWFGVACVDEVLDDIRPSDCLTCPGEDCGEGLDGPFEAGLISRGEVWRDNIINRGRFGGSDKGKGVYINSPRCRFKL